MSKFPHWIWYVLGGWFVVITLLNAFVADIENWWHKRATPPGKEG